MFLRRALLRVGICMYYHCCIVTSEIEDADTHTRARDILIMRSFMHFIIQIGNMANCSVVIKVYIKATEVRDMRQVAYGCNFSFSLQYDTLCNYLCLRIQIL